MSLETLCAQNCANHELARRLVAHMREGHLCMPFDGEAAAVSPPLTVWGGALYFEKYARIEERIAAHLHRLLKRPMHAARMPSDAGLTQEQAEAVALCCAAPVSLLSGGPGTGKTYTIAQICTALPKEHRIVVAAPTGKAASHLQASIQKATEASIEAKTLHALLGLRDAYAALTEPLHIGADVVIVDECSMIDAVMWQALLRAVSGTTRLILVGDVHQLPPVEAGSVFRDIFHYMHTEHREKTALLTKCLRSEARAVIDCASAVKKGDFAAFRKTLVTTKSVYFPPPPSDGDIAALFAHFSTFRILTAMKEGEHGVHALNRRIKGYQRSCVDPIIITKTSHALGLFNGENGIKITDPDRPENNCAYFTDPSGGFRAVPVALLPKHELAYALSIHKSQGSEFDTVLLVVPRGAEVFGRELLYTAITRGKTSVIVYGEEATLRACIERHAQRESNVLARLASRSG